MGILCVTCSVSGNDVDKSGEPCAVQWMSGGTGERCQMEQGIKMVSFTWWTLFVSLNLPVVSVSPNKGLPWVYHSFLNTELQSKPCSQERARYPLNKLRRICWPR